MVDTYFCDCRTHIWPFFSEFVMNKWRSEGYNLHISEIKRIASRFTGWRSTSFIPTFHLCFWSRSVWLSGHLGRGGTFRQCPHWGMISSDLWSVGTEKRIVREWTIQIWKNNTSSFLILKTIYLVELGNIRGCAKAEINWISATQRVLLLPCIALPKTQKFNFSENVPL